MRAPGAKASMAAVARARKVGTWLTGTATSCFQVAPSGFCAGDWFSRMAHSARAWLSVPVTGDAVAIIGENRKLLAFPLDQIPEMARGKGVRLQKYKEGGVADAKTFTLAEGLTFTDSAGRVFTVKGDDLKEWLGNRAEAGKLPPKGFPRTNRFVG